MVRGITFINRISRKLRMKGNNGNKITFGLTALLETPNNKFKKLYISNKGKIITITTLIITSGGVLIYFKHNSDSRTISNVSSDTGIKSTIVSYLYGKKQDLKSAPSKEAGFKNLLSSTYNSVKSPIVNLFMESQKPKQAVTQIDKSNENYISSALSMLRTVKDSTGKGPPPDKGREKNKPSLDEIKNKTVFPSIAMCSFISFKRRHDERSQQEQEYTGLENDSVENRWSFTTALNYIKNTAQKIRIIFQKFNEAPSTEEKCRLLLVWLNEINNIYYIIQTMNPDSIILAKYSRYSKNISMWIMNLSKDEDLKGVVALLSCATVIAFQLFLIVYFGIPVSDQLLNLAFSIFTNYGLLKNDPKIEQQLKQVVTQIREYIFVNLRKLRSADWKYFQVWESAYSFLQSAFKQK